MLPSEADGPFAGDWRLIEAGWGEARFTVEGAGITLISDGRSVRGFSGCNDYAFRLSGEADALRFGEALQPGATAPAARLEFCRGWLERIESRYLTALLAAEEAEVRAERLRLSDGNSYLLFAAIPPFPGPQLVGTQWVLEGYGDTWRDDWIVDVVGSPTLRFLGRDRFVGTLGCGSIVGSYRVVRTEVSVVSLQRFDAEECRSAFSDQDQLLAQFLDGFRAALTDDYLILTHDRLQLVYSAAPPWKAGRARRAGGAAAPSRRGAVRLPGGGRRQGTGTEPEPCDPRRFPTPRRLPEGFGRLSPSPGGGRSLAA